MKRKHILITAFFALCLTMMLSASVFAASDSVTQQGLYQDKIRIALKAPDVYGTPVEYRIQLRTDDGAYTDVATVPADTTSYDITGLNPKHHYEVKVTYSYTSNGHTYTGNWLGNLYDPLLAPVKITGAKQERWYYYIKQINAVWNKQQSVTGYEYRLYNAKNKCIKKGKTAKSYDNHAYFENVKNNHVYTMKVRAYTTFNGGTKYGAWSDTVYFVGQSPKINVRRSGKKLAVSWQKVSGATSYTIMISNKPDKGYKAVKTVKASKLRTTIKKPGKKRFYIQVRTNKKVGKKTYRSNANGEALYYTKVTIK